MTPELLVHKKVLRVRKEDSAFVYNILEAHEGLASYSTLPHRVGEAHRDLELMIPDSLLSEAQLMLKSIETLFVELAAIEDAGQGVSPEIDRR